MAHDHEQLQKDWARLALNIPADAREFKEGIGGEYFGYWRQCREMGISFQEWPLAYVEEFPGVAHFVQFFTRYGRTVIAWICDGRVIRIELQ